MNIVLRVSVLMLAASLTFACGLFSSKNESASSDEKNKTEQVKNSKSNDNSSKENTGKENSNSKNTAAGDSTEGKNTRPGKPEVKWDFKSLGTGQYDTPISQVYLIVNGKSHSIIKEYFAFSETSKESYKDFEVPTDAIIACRGWWAGAGLDIWVIQQAYELEVYTREIGETIGEDGEPGDYIGKPAKVKTISLDE
ncbi:MAG: hypothetical protein IAE90_03125 [Ignavibacteria bacterium]|nr:hypothetical protein [Ignavibacteria bacterium]